MKRDKVGLVAEVMTKWMFTPTQPLITTHSVADIMLSPKSKKKRNVSARMA